MSASAGAVSAVFDRKPRFCAYFSRNPAPFRQIPGFSGRRGCANREHWNHVRIWSRMIELAPRSTSPIARFGGQPIAIAAVALVIVVLGIGSIALWRAYTGTAPETDRAVATRQLQARAAQASEQLVEKTKGLEATQQELIDQLQVVQDQLQTVRRLLAVAADRYQEAFRAGGNADRGDRRAAAILCQRASLRARRQPTAASGRRKQRRGSGARTASAASRRASRPPLGLSVLNAVATRRTRRGWPPCILVRPPHPRVGSARSRPPHAPRQPVCDKNLSSSDTKWCFPPIFSNRV